MSECPKQAAILVEWQTFPDQTVDPRFVERLAVELSALGVTLDDDLFFICRSGGRSLAAAKAMAATGYAPATTSPAPLKGRLMTKGIEGLVSPGCKPSGG